MSKIKSLADQLKARIEEEREPVFVAAVPVIAEVPPVMLSGDGLDLGAADVLVSALEAFSVAGTEKIVIRLDKRTMTMLRRMKLATGVDMTRVIVFSLSEFFSSRPWLNEYISKTLNQFEP